MQEVIAEASARRGWSNEKASVVVDALRQTGKWGLDQLFLGFRADFKCEYCGLDFFSSVGAYKLWQQDHIDRHAGDHLENLALACLVCNVKLKNRWTPSAWQGMTRSEKIKDARAYVIGQRKLVQEEIDSYRKLLE